MKLARPLLLLSAALHLACGAASAPLRAEMGVMKVAAAPAPLARDHFEQDVMGGLSEEAMRRILKAPVFLERGARLGVVPVITAYGLDGGLPVSAVTGDLTDSLSRSGVFEVVSEVSTDWPGTAHSIGGLRELASRYRAEYLLLYRHRFVDRDWTNAWGWLYLTGVGALFAPSKTLEAAGVLEATLLDVKTGTLLFTVFERVHEQRDSSLWRTTREARRMREGLLKTATEALTGAVMSKVRALVAARPASRDESVAAAGEL